MSPIMPNLGSHSSNMREEVAKIWIISPVFGETRQYDRSLERQWVRYYELTTYNDAGSDDGDGDGGNGAGGSGGRVGVVVMIRMVVMLDVCGEW